MDRLGHMIIMVVIIGRVIALGWVGGYRDGGRTYLYIYIHRGFFFGHEVLTYVCFSSKHRS